MRLLISIAIAATLSAQSFTLVERFGVSHPDQVVEFPHGSPITGMRMIGPQGAEVPFQQLSNNAVLVRTNLPASRIALTRRVNTGAASNLVAIDVGALYVNRPVAGTPIQFVAPAPLGVTAGVTYYLRPMTQHYTLATTPALLDTVDIQSDSEWVVRFPQLLVSGQDFVAANHQYKTGDPITITSTGAVPSPLSTNTVYYVIRVNANVFRVSATRVGAFFDQAITLADAGTGTIGTEVRWTWTLQAGTPAAQPANPVTMTTAGGVHEVTNGRTGFRFATQASNGAPFTRAPIQGVRLATGQWAATGPNLIYGHTTTSVTGILTGYTVETLESGPMLTRLRATYTTNRPEWSSLDPGNPSTIASTDTATDIMQVAGDRNYWLGVAVTFRANGGSLPCGVVANQMYWVVEKGNYDSGANRTPIAVSATKNGPKLDLTCAGTGSPQIVETMLMAGTGSFSETVSLYAGDRSIQIESDLDSRLQYYLNFNLPGVFEPNRARYRGNNTSSASCGYSTPGTVAPPYTDAFVDLPATAASDYFCSGSTIQYAPNWYLPASGTNTGWYWLMWQAGAAYDAPTVGYYLGRLSRVLTPLMAGPGLYTGASHFAAGGARAAGITFYGGFRTPSGPSVQRIRREWRIYSGRVGEMWTQPEVGQPIAVDRNITSNINLSRIASYELEFADPPGGWPPPFALAPGYAAQVARVRSDATYRNALLTDAVELREIILFWQADTTAAAEILVSSLEAFMRHWGEINSNRDGSWDSYWHYYQPMLVFQTLASRANAILHSPTPTAAQKARTKAAMALIASIFWDNDWIPWDNDSGESVGTVNQGIQYSMYRTQLIEMLSGANSALAPKVSTGRGYLDYAITYLNPSGAPKGSSHYHATGMDPVMSNYLLLKNNGFNIASVPVWQLYGQWMLDALTPPEPRFGTMRKMVSSGDGVTESSAMHGMMATLLRGVNDGLAANLQWAWLQQNSATRRTFGQFTAPSAIVIDEAATSTAPTLRSAHYDGYWSVFRHAFATPNETAAWFTHGALYNDHRHNDYGQVTIYAHNAPLSIDWNPNLYYPNVPGPMAHNRVSLESDLSQAWNSDNMALGAGGNTINGVESTAFLAHRLSTVASATFRSTAAPLWTRRTTMVAADPQYPALLVQDTFTGAAATAAKIVTWNMAATGAVAAPGGSYTPTERLLNVVTQSPAILPSNGPVVSLSTGPQRFGFTGITWPQHATSGIDWDLYVVPDGSQSFLIGNWGHVAHGSREQAEYNTANGQTFREQQHILRVRGTGGFTTLIVPYRKGEAPGSRTVTSEACGLQIAQTGSTLCLGADGYTHVKGTTTTVSSFGAATFSGGGMTLGGGAIEVVLTATTVRLSANSAAATLTATIPGVTATIPGWTRSGSTYTRVHGGGAVDSGDVAL